MTKKIHNLFMCLGLLVQIFVFVNPVLAEETKELKIKINSLEQGGENLNIVDGVYIVDKYDELWLDFDLENATIDDNYTIRVNGMGFGYSKDMRQTISISPNEEIQNIEIKVCDNYECDTIYTQETIKLKVSFYDEIKDSKVLISEVTQGGKTIEYFNNSFDLNNKQDVTFKVKGQNLIDDAKYKVSTGSYEFENIYLGSELEKGVYITHYTNLNNNDNYHNTFYVHTNLVGLGFFYNAMYFNGVDYINPIYNLSNDEMLPNHNSKIIYTNFDKEIEKTNIEYRNYSIINSKYYNANNSLSLDILGQEYSDRDYSILVKVKQGDNLLYTKEDTINGLLLNKGYKLELNNLNLELNKELENAELYNFYISVDGITIKYDYKYNSVGKDVSLSSNVFFENGKKNLSVFRGNGNYFFDSGIYDTNKNVFTKYSSIYLRYAGKNFDVNQEYEYILEYGSFDDNFYISNQNYDIELKRGTVNGLVLNTVGLVFKVDNNKNYKHPTYRLTIKKDDEILFASAPVIYTVNSPTLANVSLSANNKILYLQTSDYSYIATRNAPIDLVISGIGFADDEVYPFEFCYDEVREDGAGGVCQNINIKGKDLNEGVGTAKLRITDKIDEKSLSYNFYVMCDMNSLIYEHIAIQGGFEVKFVDSKDLFPNLTNYFVDNVSDLIKNISKNTSVEDFTKNIDVKDNGKVIIYDNTGTNEIIGNVGTGMIARVLNEYDENVLDLDVVVKGDVSGDGNISITDLVKVKRHLAEEEVLIGVYEVAGNITDTGKIGITDLVKISRDVAKIQEVQ